MPAGGYRQGTPGTAYPRRTDLAADRQPVRSAKSKVQGDRKRREQAQEVMPLSQVRQPPQPGSLTPLTAPTERPGEPVTAGLPIGAGPGPGPGAPVAGADALFDLRAVAALYPEYPGLMRAISYGEQMQ